MPPKKRRPAHGAERLPTDYGSRATKAEYVRVLQQIARQNPASVPAFWNNASVKRVARGRAYKDPQLGRAPGWRNRGVQRVASAAQLAHRERFARLASTGALRQLAQAARAGMPKHERAALLNHLEHGTRPARPPRPRVHERDEADRASFIPRNVVRRIEHEQDREGLLELANVPMNS